MIDGTPARFETFTWIIRENQLRLAYSSRYTAAPTPSGNATAAVIAIMYSVPVTAVKIPARSGLDDWKLCRNPESRNR